MQRGGFVIAAIVALAVGLSSCVPYSQSIREIQRLAVHNKPQQALGALENSGMKNAEPLLYLLNKGLLLRQQQQYAASIRVFEAAKARMRDLEAISVSGTAGSLAVSETSSDYTGKPYERIMLHVYQALNYLALDNLAGARVEALQIDLLLRRLHPESHALPYGADAIGRYLAGLVFEANHEPDQALVAYRQALRIYTEQVMGVPKDLQFRLLRLTQLLGLQNEHRQLRQRFSWQKPISTATNTGTIIVILSAGLVPRRIGVSSLAQDFTTGRFYRISLPKLIPYSHSLQAAWLSAPQQQTAAEPVSNLENAAMQTLAAEMPKLTLRAIARMVIKEAAADAVAREHGEGAASLVNFLGVIVEQADTRQWGLLPQRVYLASLELPAGEHDVTLTMNTHRGLVEKTFENVTVQKGEIAFLSTRVY